MKFVKCMPENLSEDKMMIYGVLNARKGDRMCDVPPDEVIKATGFILGRDDQADKNLLAVITESGQILYTVSNIFISQFINCVDTLETSALPFKVGAGTNKSGRPYITFNLVY